MLTIASTPLPETALTYVAFRVSFLETLERSTLASQMGDWTAPFGYLTEVPFLRGTAPQVQLDALLETWAKHASPQIFEATLVDESVVYAVCETAARLIRTEPDLVRQWLEQGPRQDAMHVDARLADEIQNLHLELANDGDFLLISQFQDIPPDEARRLKEKFDLNHADCEVMFELLGRWHFSPLFSKRGTGLLTSLETARTRMVFTSVIQRIHE